MPKVTMIPATINPKTRLPEMIRAKKTGGRLRSCFHGQRRAVHQLCSADGVLHKPDQRQSGLGICPRLYGRRYQRFEYPQAHRFQRNDRRRPGRTRRPDRDKKRQPLCQKHRRQLKNHRQPALGSDLYCLVEISGIEPLTS